VLDLIDNLATATATSRQRYLDNIARVAPALLPETGAVPFN